MTYRYSMKEFRSKSSKSFLKKIDYYKDEPFVWAGSRFRVMPYKDGLVIHEYFPVNAEYPIVTHIVE